jgi:hypothetical protein
MNGTCCTNRICYTRLGRSENTRPSTIVAQVGDRSIQIQIKGRNVLIFGADRIRVERRNLTDRPDLP